MNIKNYLTVINFNLEEFKNKKTRDVYFVYHEKASWVRNFWSNSVKESCVYMCRPRIFISHLPQLYPKKMTYLTHKGQKQVTQSPKILNELDYLYTLLHQYPNN